ncbi:MAG: ComEA family DNA-binding protein [Raoultibacter sp.]
MSFTDSAESLRAKLHLSEIKTPALIGVIIAALIAVVLIIQSVAGLMTSSRTEIVRDDTTQVETTEQTDHDAETPVAEVCIHVTGAVVSPGMYSVAEGSRVQAVIDAAGGFAEGASTTAINLARVVADGEQIIVPTLEEAQAAASGGPGVGVSGGGALGGGAAVQVGGKVNINTADVTALDSLPGIGPSTAQKIIADREANGPFATIEDLQRVSGIGEKKYASLVDSICVG